jgi:hypothetical protein
MIARALDLLAAAYVIAWGAAALVATDVLPGAFGWLAFGALGALAIAAALWIAR